MEASFSHWLDLIQIPLSKNLPNEIVLDILVRLPVKSIVRFKCVSKLMGTLFTDPCFVEMHLGQAITKNNDCLLVRHLVELEKEISAWQIFDDCDEVDEEFDNDDPSSKDWLSVESSSSKLIYTGTIWYRREIFSLWNKETFEEFGKLEVPNPSTTDYYSLVGSINGLICLNESNSSNTYHNLNMFLWNPSTREFRTLPRYIIDRFTSAFMVVGLGFTYNPIINDYKVVRIIHLFHSATNGAATYSLHTNCWRKIDADFQGCFFHEHLSQASLNGALHWMVTTKSKVGTYQDFILSFDTSADKFNKILLPDFGYHDNDIQCKSLSLFDNSLAIFVHLPLQETNRFDVWVMKEYGEVLSWTKLYSVHQEDLMMPLHFVGNSAVIMKNDIDGELVLGDLNFKRIKNIEGFNWIRLVKYVESLVSPRGRSGISACINLHGSASDPCCNHCRSG